MSPVMMTVGAIGLLAAIMVGGFLFRLRWLASRVGSFECALREAGEKRLTSGIAVFGDDDVRWYRLVSVSLSPRRRLFRDLLELDEVHHRGQQGQIVDVSCRYDGRPLELAMVEDSHSALVAWLESAPPRQPTLF